MARKNKLTNSSDESEIASVLSGDCIFSIPYFQRPYKWKTERIKQFESDLLEVVDTLIDGNPDNHFLGAIIVHGRRSNPSDPTVYEVIDGQQRLTTVYIFIAAIISSYCELGEYGDAVGLFQKYLALGRHSGISSNVKLHPGRDDRQQLNDVLKDLLNDKTLQTSLNTFNPIPLTSSGESNGAIKRNYKQICRFLLEQHKQSGVDRIRLISRALLDHFSVVQIDVNDPANGPKIFDSLNSQQEPMTIGDLIRNEIFSRISDLAPSEIERHDQQIWQPFYSRFRQSDKNLFDTYFFPYGLTQNANLSKSEVYNYLRESWKSESDPKAIIGQLERFQNAFIDLATGSNFQEHPKAISKCLENLYSLGLPAATYPFLMLLSDAIKIGQIGEVSVAVDLLTCTESFLVRRAVCGIEPTGLHSVFKRLWQDLAGDFTKAKMILEIGKYSTVHWPSEGEFKKAICTRDLYGTGIVNFVIREYDRSLGGEVPVNVAHVEHVLPQTITTEWHKYFSNEQHAQLKDRLANLLPISSALNASLSNDMYEKKRSKYQTDSMFKATRDFGNRYLVWTPEFLGERSDDLGNWALERWAD